MEPESASVDTTSNSDEQSSDSRDSKIGVYCTLRSRSSSAATSSSANSKQRAYQPETGEEYAIKDALTAYCTVGRRLKNFIKANAMDTNAPYTKLEESLSTSFTNFGMSNDLSTESIRNACDCYDQSDDEIDPTQSIDAMNSSLLDKNENLNFRRSVARSSARTASFDRKRRHEIFHPYCTIRRDRHDRQNLQRSEPDEEPKLDHCLDSAKLSQDSVEAYQILNELDAILDNHESIDITSLSSATPEKVEDYLLELDAYLEQMDQSSKSTDDQQQQNHHDINKVDHHNPVKRINRSRTLPKKLPRRTIGTDILDEAPESKIDSSSDASLDRGHKYRSTIGSTRSRITNDNFGLMHEKCPKRRQKSWRRHSMRKTALLDLPDHRQQQQDSLHSEATCHIISERLGLQNAYSRNTSPADVLTTSFVMPSSPSTHAASNGVMLAVGPTNSLEDFHIFNTIDLTTHPGAQNLPESAQELRRCVSDADCTVRNGGLTHIDIINDILHSTSCNDAFYQHRPRQLGRRAEGQPRVVSIMAETGSSGSVSPRITVNHDRPMSAPAAAPIQRASMPLPTSTGNRRYISSEPSSVGSSRNPSPVSLLSSTASSSIASTNAVPPVNSSQQRSDPLDDPQASEREESNINSQWPHGFSRTLALLCCTLGLFNISRFSVLTIHYGGNFLLQFFILSIIFGIPMLWLQMCLGAKIKSGPISMWKISPICKGIGISLTLAQCIMALYSAISLAWCLIYFRDSFISRNDKYRWQEPYHLFRRSGNITNNLTETVADYFNGLVLQRWQLSDERKDQPGGVRFQLAFNVAVIWIAIFLFLCKGLKSFGKVVLGLTLLPLVIFIVICCKLLYIVDFSTVQNIFSATDFEDFLVNSKSWTAAAQETFLTWILLGPSVVAISAKSAEKSEGKTILRRDAIIVVLLTLFGLSVAAIFGYACIQILQNNEYVYLPGSFEYTDTYTFLYSLQVPIPTDRIGVPAKWAPHYSSVMGECYRRSTSTAFRESGFQALRLITELFPATVAVATQEFISPVWTLMAYLMFLIFGLAQLCAMWKPISSLLGNSTSSVLLSCVAGLLLGIPFATEMGMAIIHYLDYVIGGAWWLLILWTAQIFGVFLIRGRPYNGDVLVNDLRMASSMSAFLALSWNVLLPIGLVALAIIEYKVTVSSQLFHWRGKSYFPLWSRKVGGLIQIGFMLIVPITAIVQIYRYLSTGPTDLFERLQLLYRPLIVTQEHRRNRPNIERLAQHQQATIGINLTNIEAQQVQDDAPPKYTPPPSYTTATGARLAKLLRQSIRRSVRRIMGEPSRPRPSIPTGSRGHTTTTPSDSSLPPEYSTVLNNPSGDECSQLEIGPRALYNSQTQRTLSLERYRAPQHFVQSNTLGNSRHRNAQTFTAFDVAQLLRSSHRHERSASAITAMDNALRTSSLRHHKNTSRSAENLVLNAAPLGESSAMVGRSNPRDSNESTSVI